MMTSFEGKLFFFESHNSSYVSWKTHIFFCIAAFISFFQSFIITVTCLSQQHTNDGYKSYIIIMKGIHFPIMVPKKSELYWFSDTWLPFQRRIMLMTCCILSIRLLRRLCMRNLSSCLRTVFCEIVWLLRRLMDGLWPRKDSANFVLHIPLTCLKLVRN